MTKEMKLDNLTKKYQPEVMITPGVVSVVTGTVSACKKEMKKEIKELKKFWKKLNLYCTLYRLTKSKRIYEKILDLKYAYTLKQIRTKEH